MLNGSPSEPIDAIRAALEATTKEGCRAQAALEGLEAQRLSVADIDVWLAQREAAVRALGAADSKIAILRERRAVEDTARTEEQRAAVRARVTALEGDRAALAPRLDAALASLAAEVKRWQTVTQEVGAARSAAGLAALPPHRLQLFAGAVIAAHLGEIDVPPRSERRSLPGSFTGLAATLATESW